MVEVGQPAPEFTLPDQEGTPVSLSDFRGQRVVVYFPRPTRRDDKAVVRSSRPGCRASPGEYSRAMSQENVEIVADTIAAFNRGDLDAGSDFWTDDLDYRVAQGAPDDPGPIRGKEAMRTYVEDWLDTFDDFRGEVIELIDAGDDVIVVMRIGGRAKLSGVETDLTFAAIYTIRDGKIARGREYWTREQALEAAGLRE
jgi:ketosteroid isomerase-like protein